MGDHDDLEVVVYDGPEDGRGEWLKFQAWSEDDRKPYVTYEEHPNTVTTGWLLTFPVFDEPEVEWWTVPLSAEPEGRPIRSYDDAVEVAKQYLRRNPHQWEPRWKENPSAPDSQQSDSPDEIKPGEFEVTFTHDDGDGISTPMEVHFTWEETSYATWWCDIWEGAPDLSPGSSAPANGWASWGNGEDALIAFTWRDVGIDGWAHIVSGAPGKGDDYALFEKETWVEFGRKIVAAVHGNPLPGMTRQTYN